MPEQSAPIIIPLIHGMAGRDERRMARQWSEEITTFELGERWMDARTYLFPMENPLVSHAYAPGRTPEYGL